MAEAPPPSHSDSVTDSDADGGRDGGHEGDRTDDSQDETAHGGSEDPEEPRNPGGE